MQHQIVVVGVGYAGLLCALRLARRVGSRARISLVGPSRWFVERIRQHQIGTGQRLLRRDLTLWLRGSGVNFVESWVDGIDLECGRLRLGRQALAYDELVLATGSRIDADSVSGVAEHALTLDASRAPLIARRLDRLPNGSRVLVCGGGLSGIEASAEIVTTRPDLRVSLVTRGELGRGLSQPAREHLRRFFSGRRLEVIERAPVTALEGRRAYTEGGDELDFDLCVWTAGFRAPPLAREAGLDTDAAGRVRVGATLRSPGRANVLAVGDAAALESSTRAPLHLSCKIAMPMALHLGDNLARRRLDLPERPFDFSDAAVCMSLGRRDGVIDLRHADGRPRGRILRGRLAAFAKERVCRYTVARMRLESARWLPIAPLEREPRLPHPSPQPKMPTG